MTLGVPDVASLSICALALPEFAFEPDNGGKSLYIRGQCNPKIKCYILKLTLNLLGKVAGCDALLFHLLTAKFLLTEIVMTAGF